MLISYPILPYPSVPHNTLNVSTSIMDIILFRISNFYLEEQQKNRSILAFIFVYPFECFRMTEPRLQYHGCSNVRDFRRPVNRLLEISRKIAQEGYRKVVTLLPKGYSIIFIFLGQVILIIIMIIIMTIFKQGNLFKT